MNMVKLYDLAWDVQRFLRRLRLEWVESLEVEVDCFDVVSSQMVLLGSDGLATYMPSYKSYNETWVKSGFQNPLQYDWIEFDPLDELCLRYIEVVLDVFEDQVDLWYYGSGCDTLTYFIEFTGALRLLYNCAMGIVDEGDTDSESDDDD